MGGIILLLLLIAAPARAQHKSWVDKDGVTHDPGLYALHRGRVHGGPGPRLAGFVDQKSRKEKELTGQ